MFSLPSDVTAASLLKAVHPAVEDHADRWQVGLDAYDGDGGFLDGSYLWQFPRETQAEWVARKAQARYHNVCATLIDYYARKVFGDEIVRESGNPELDAWFQNVDGAGTDLTTYMRHSLVKALAAGHVGILADKTPDAPTGPAKADEKAAVFLTRFLPTAILDWRLTRDEQLTAVKLREDVESPDLLAEQDDREDAQALLWDTEEWVRVSGPDDAVSVERATHTLGLVPLVVLRPFRSARWPFIGRALLGDGSILKALYNRASEQDVVLRDQAFSIFVVGLPATGEIDAAKAKAAMGDEIGPTRALFVYGDGDYKTPSMDVPQTQEAHQSFLVRELYRLAHVPFEKDSRDAMSAEAITLQHEELASQLAGVAQECRRVELELAKLYFDWTSATPEAAKAAFEAANVQIRYPEEFFKGDPEKELTVLVDAMRAVPSPTYEKEIQKVIVAKTATSLDDATKDKILAEIEAGQAARPDPMTLDPTTLRQGAAARLSGFVNAQDGEAA